MPINTKIPSSKGNLAVAIHFAETETGKLAILCPGFLDSKDYKGLYNLAEALRAQVKITSLISSHIRIIFTP